jgi:hypothetical protein
MKFYSEDGAVYFEGLQIAADVGVPDQASAVELAEFFNWMYELYARDKRGISLPSRDEKSRDSWGPVCDLDGRCG